MAISTATATLMIRMISVKTMLILLLTRRNPDSRPNSIKRAKLVIRKVGNQMIKRVSKLRIRMTS